ncbi:MAG: 6-carboxyhexanoate--CoA ligase [Thermodesulfovibrionales bacterium]|nr:6-carboxyhexanoate--CoA ligase [Thermodesulfovibrionales bacterium]
MEKLWNIRMRASQEGRGEKQKTSEIHISGAEGLYTLSEMQRMLRGYIERALHHPKGKPDTITLTLEKVRQEPLTISTLPLSTVISDSLSEARKISGNMLRALGISKKALRSAFAVLQKGNMRGAALISAEKGMRLEHDRRRGVRVSRLGIAKPALRILSSRLARLGINIDTVKEALILASKVASSSRVIAELCISDDPHYTTGYVASSRFGYMRIPGMKQKGRKIGGRVFFVQEGSDIDPIIQYLERTPVMVDHIGPCKGIQQAEEILDSHNL